LKQLQLIQILGINPRCAVALEQVAGNAPAVNRLWQASKRAKAASVCAEAAFAMRNPVILGGLRFTAR
jgi:hypothetical protein